MENSPFNTNNPYKSAPKSQSTLPLEPRVPCSGQETDAPYTPKPPKTAKDDNNNTPETNPMGTTNPMTKPGPRPRPTVTYQPGQEPEIPAQPHELRPYPTPTRPGQATRPAQPNGYRPTIPGGAPIHPGVDGPRNPINRPTILDSGNNGKKRGLIIGAVVAALLIVGAGCWWYFGYRDSNQIETEDLETEENIYPENVTGKDENSIPPSTENTQASTNGQATTTSTEQTPGVGAGSEATSLFNRPLTYTGTVTPGGVATLNIILFQNGRLEGSIDYSGGKSMPLFGSYTWTDNGHMMNINFTVSSNKDKTYSESWMGHSSYIKDDLAHTLTFKRINTSNGQSMTASFALRP